MKIGKRTGLVCVIEAVPAGHQVGIAWTTNGEGVQIGFAYDEDATRREEVRGKVMRACEEAGLGVRDALADGSWWESAEVEEVSQDLFFDWFGGYPSEAYLFLDAWGKADDYSKVYGAGASSVVDAVNTAARKRSRIAGAKAGLATAAVAAAGVAVFVALSFVISNGLPVAVSAYTLLSVVLMACGSIFLISELQAVSRRFFKRFSNRGGE